MKDKNTLWLDFHSNLQGFDCFRNGVKIEKYILFWTGYNASEIISNKTDIQLKFKTKK